MTKLLLLDRDGTITQNRVRPGDYINDPSELELIPGVLERLEQYNRDGWMIVVVSNQGGVEKGFITLHKCIQGMWQTIVLSDGNIIVCYFCPEAWPNEGETFIKCGYRGDVNAWGWSLTSPENIDHCYREGEITQGFRKPNGGMIQAAISDCAVKPTEILMVGDRDEDHQAAINAGVPFMWAEQWRNGK